MRMRFGPTAFIILSAFADQVPAGAQDLSLAPDEAATLRVDSAGRASFSDRGRADWTPFDVAAARNFVVGEYDQGIGPTSVDSYRPGMPEARPLPEKSVRIRFLTIADSHSLLLLENGYDLALVYRARIAVDGEPRATDVCVVLPRNRSAEHWPHPIGRLELSAFRLVPWQEGRPPVCE
jgi:hypothetical protein